MTADFFLVLTFEFPWEGGSVDVEEGRKGERRSVVDEGEARRREGL